MTAGRILRFGAILLPLCLVACGKETAPPEQESQQEIPAGPEDENTDTEEITATEPDDTILIAYFTRLPNTQSGDDLDAVVQGGGPYGEIGDDFEHADVDAISSASITVLDDGVKGNVEAVAEWIAEYTGGELFSIETTEKYPLDYDTLIDQGGEEKQAGIRPELSTQVEDMDQYSVIYLGYPNWYYDMPMALYSFLETYDLTGKTIIPFAVSAGSGFSGTISSIESLQPGARVIHDGLAIAMREVKDSEDTVKQWLDGLELEP